MKQKLGAWLRILVSVGILGYLFNRIFQEQAAKYFADRQIDPATLAWQERARIVWSEGPAALWAVFREVNPWWFVAALICFGLVCVIGTVRWQLILRVQGLEIPFLRAVSIFFIGMFFNAFMLGSTGGDVVKAWYAAHETHHKKAEAVATVVVDRIIGLLALFVITLLMMVIFYHRVFDDVRLRVFAFVTLAVVVGTVGITALSFWRGFADKLPGLRRSLQRLPKYDTLKRMVDACRVYATHPAVVWRTVLWSFGVHIFVMLSIVCIGYGLRVQCANGAVDYFLYLPIINTVAAVPITISGFGVRELMYAEMFGEVGVPQAQAVALSLLGYIATLFWSLVGAVFYLTHRKELPPDLHHEET
jgi:glycosyltransferase 2 family protein